MTENVKDIKPEKSVEPSKLPKDVCLAAIKFLSDDEKGPTLTGYTQAVYLATVVNELRKYVQTSYPD